MKVTSLWKFFPCQKKYYKYEEFLQCVSSYAKILFLWLLVTKCKFNVIIHLEAILLHILFICRNINETNEIDWNSEDGRPYTIHQPLYNLMLNIFVLD
jgi:hypothetical protein